jgi:hypothetical protein
MATVSGFACGGGGMSGAASLRWFLVAGLIAAFSIAGIASYYASSQPDGLERVAQDEGFLDDATEHAAADSPLADYGVAGIDDPRASVGLAGVIGVAVTAVVAGGGFWLLTRRRGGGGDRRPSTAS